MSTGMCRAYVRVAACAATIFSTVFLQGCGVTRPYAPAGSGDSPGPGPAPAPAPPTSGIPHCKSVDDDSGLCSECDEGYKTTGVNKTCLYTCTTTLTLGPIVEGDKKGLMMDDTTHHWCSDSLHSVWANTDDSVKSFRIAKAWQKDWSEKLKTIAWDNIVTFAHTNNAKALVGTSLSCTEEDDDNDWQDVLKLLKRLGSDHVLGVAIGNEMELVWMKGASPTCVTNLWENGDDVGYVQRKFESRVNDLDALGGAWSSIKVTSVFGTFIFAGARPFVNIAGEAKVLPFLKHVVSTYKDRYAFSLNNYPYFDTGNSLDPGTSDKCTAATRRSVCFDQGSCSFINIARDMRERMADGGVGASDNELWITETGWSSPIASTLSKATFAMASCPAFSTLATFEDFYDNFLKWDLNIPGSGEKGPDRVFWFGMRDSASFAAAEHFGLGGSGDPTKLCENTTCKMGAIHSSSPTPAPTPGPDSPRRRGSPRRRRAPRRRRSSSSHTCAKIGCGNHDGTCWCSDSCESHGSCCPDYESECGGPAPTPTPPETCEEIGCGNHKVCWCTPSCLTHNSCCSDYETFCPQTVALANVTAVL